MKAEKGDYCLVKAGASNAKELIRILTEDAGKYSGKLDRPKKSDDGSGDTVTLEFGRKDIICNFGKSPSPGAAYGVKVEPLLKTEPDPYWGEIRIYKKMEEVETLAVMDQLKTFKLALKEKRHRIVKPLLELRAPSGKMAGRYKYRPKEEQDILTAMVPEDKTDFQYVLAHEYAHGLWFRSLTKQSRLRWVKLYHEYITLLDSDERDLEKLLDEVHTAKSISAGLRAVDDDEKLLFKECIKHISRVHGLNKTHLDMMLDADDSLTDLWPQQIELSEKEVLVSDYARKSPEELWAEAYSFWFIGRKLPKVVQALVEKTLTRLIK